MPVFIDEVVFKGQVGPGAATQGGAPPEPAGADAGRDALIAEVTQAVIEHLERALERIGER
jgi:Family of unknown function (DUF5908)